MRNLIYRPVRLSIFLSALCGLLGTGPALGSDDAYLQALEAEAEASSNINTAQAPSVSPAAGPSAQPGKPTDGDTVRMQEFEQRLSKQLPATFKTYRMLSSEDKRLVIDTYFENNKNMPVATRMLFNLYFKVR